MNNNDCTIIVNSCDDYEDVWIPFFTVLNSMWKDCPYKIILNTESKKFEFDKLKIDTLQLFNGNDKDYWGKRLRLTLDEIDSEFVIMLFDDYILEGKVNIDKIEKCINWMKKDKNIAVFYFSNSSGINILDNKYKDFELVGLKNDYKLNTAPAIWRKEKLKEYTGMFDTPWAWEFFGSARTYTDSALFYCANIGKEDTFIYNYKLGGAIHRGKWVKSIIEPVVIKYKLNINLNNRGFENESLEIYNHSLIWKIKFLYTGFKMIRFKVAIYLFRAIKKRMMRIING